jgi:hypothetical protein
MSNSKTANLDDIVYYINSSISYSAPELYRANYELSDHREDNEHIFSFLGKMSNVRINICIKLNHKIYVRFLYDDHEFFKYELENFSSKCVGAAIYRSMFLYFTTGHISSYNPLNFVQLLASENIN